MGRKNKGFMWFASIIILVMGLGSLAAAAYGMLDWGAGLIEARHAQTWPAVEARILSLSREDSRSPHGFARTVLDGRFAYTYEGKEYVGTNITLAAGKYDQVATKVALSNRLSEARVAARAVPCYVDPQNPHRAVLSRDYERAAWWTMLWTYYCALLFGAFWVVFFVVIVVGWRKRDRLEVEYPDKPWMWRPQWQRNGLKPEPSAATIFWPLGIAGTIGMLPLVLVVLPETLRQGASFQTSTFLIAGLSVPLVFLVAAIVSTLRRRMVRSVLLRLENVPVILGQPLRGELVMRLRSAAPQSVHAQLQHVQITSKGKNTQKSTTPVGEVDATMASDRELGDSTTYRFELPTHVEWPEHNDDSPSEKTLWELIVWVGSPRAKFKFAMPLFHESRATSGQTMASAPATPV